MSLKEVEFDLDGPPLTAEVRSGFGQLGSYRLLLWEAESNVVLEDWPGNFLNPDDDEYPLPGPPAHQHNRICEALISLALVPPHTFDVSLVIHQGDEEIGSVEDIDEEGDPDANKPKQVWFDLFLKLKGGC